MIKSCKFLVIGSLLLLNACRFYYEEKQSKERTVSQPPTSPMFPETSALSKTSFQEVNEKIFVPHCIVCHGSSGGINLESYSLVKKNISAIEKTTLQLKTMPKNSALNSSEEALLTAWIKNGAPEFIKDQQRAPAIPTNSTGTQGPTPSEPTPAPVPTPTPLPAPTPTPQPTPTPVEPIKPNFDSIKKNILVGRCIVCHSAGNSASGVPLANLKLILSSPRDIVIPFNADESGLIIAVERTDEKKMPPTKSRYSLSNDEISVLRRWVEDGAPESENSGPSPGPKKPTQSPLVPTFESIKANIFDKSCLSCHSPGGKAFGVPLSNLKEILESPRELVLPGNYEESGLYIALTREDDKVMPPPENAVPLKSEEIEIIKKWIDSGAPEK